MTKKKSDEDKSLEEFFENNKAKKNALKKILKELNKNETKGLKSI